MSRFSEAYASILAELLGFEPISYWLDSSLGYFDVVTYSDIGYVSLCKYYALDKGLFRLSFFDYVCEKCKGTAIKPKMLTLDEIFEYLLMLPINIQQKIFEILHFDSIICNVDRHIRNIELVSNKHGDIVDVIPIFDCGASLIGESVDENIVRFYDVTPDYTIHLFTVGTTNDMSIKNFLDWLEYSRCVPMNRVDLSRYLDRIGVKEYDVIRMIEKTKGRMYPLDDIRIELYDIEEVLE